MSEIVVLKGKSTTDCKKLCGSIVSVLSKETRCNIRTIGAGALNQATKAIILAGQHFSAKGKTIKIQVCFESVESDVAGADSITSILQKLELENI